ncbi:class I SAM-dependent methyltransferase [Microbacterium sp. ZW T5_45]|uniref:class I SAM-dependent methyltransferase n=1 Tax=Microbacterium sp. ZW T5_45 TaxID=3378080 RepID=UPI003853AC17
MPDFPYARLRRHPDVEAENLQAYDATDLLLTEWGIASGIAGDEIAVIGDEYGAITLALTDAGRTGIRVHQDLATGRRALARNAADLQMGGGYTEHELDSSLLVGATLVLLQLPKSLAELEEIADAVARWAAPGVVLVAGGRVKHMTLAQNDVLARSFETVQPQRAERKSRLIIASEALPVPAEPPFPVSMRHGGLTLVAHGGAFAGPRLDIGTRVLLEVLGLALPELRRSGMEEAETGPSAGTATGSSGVLTAAASVIEAASTVVDLGCGTGALAAAYALAHPRARVIATDRSAAAAASARGTVVVNGLAGRVEVTHDDAGSRLPDASVDLVLLNPPFHLGNSVHSGAATRLFEAAARLLRPGGQLWTVYNSSLRYRAELTGLIGETEQVSRTPKFTVTRSVRRG